MITFGIVGIKEVLDCKELLDCHWQEVALNKEKIKLSVDEHKYIQLENLNSLMAFSAKDGDKIVGYAVFFVTPHLHYADNLFAANDVLYISPEYRKGTIAFKFVKYIESELKEIKCDVISYRFKKDDKEAFMNRMGYSRNEVVYTKYIGE